MKKKIPDRIQEEFFLFKHKLFHLNKIEHVENQCLKVSQIQKISFQNGMFKVCKIKSIF